MPSYFADTTLVAGELNRRLAEDPTKKQELPDFVFVANPGYMIARVRTVNGQASIQAIGQDFDNFLPIMTGDDTLPLFFVGLNICLGQVRLHSVDYLSLWQQLMGQVIERIRRNP